MSTVEAKKILIIEDNPQYLKAVEHQIGLEGFITFTSQDGLSGLNLARRLKPDLIVLDLMLPSMDGYKVCRFLKFDRRLRTIPIVVLTSLDTEADADLAKLTRADAFLVKTVRPAILRDVIRRLILNENHIENKKILFQGEGQEIEKYLSVVPGSIL